MFTAWNGKNTKNTSLFSVRQENQYIQGEEIYANNVKYKDLYLSLFFICHHWYYSCIPHRNVMISLLWGRKNGEKKNVMHVVDILSCITLLERNRRSLYTFGTIHNNSFLAKGRKNLCDVDVNVVCVYVKLCLETCCLRKGNDN